MSRWTIPWAGDNLANATVALFLALGGISAILATIIWLLR